MLKKLEALHRLECLYKDLLQKYINLIIEEKLPVGKFLTSKQLPTLNEIVHSQWKQVCYKQAAQCVRSELVKIKQRVFKKYIHTVLSIINIDGLHRSVFQS